MEFRRGVNPRRERLKLDNYVTRAMQDVMKLVRVASNRHLRNWCGKILNGDKLKRIPNPLVTMSLIMVGREN